MIAKPRPGWMPPRWTGFVTLVACVWAAVFLVRQLPLGAQASSVFAGPTSSQPLALSASGKRCRSSLRSKSPALRPQ